MTSLLLLLLLLRPAHSVPFGYQSRAPLDPSRPSSLLDPSTFSGSVRYDPLHHALYLVGATYSTVFDGSDLHNLPNEQPGWDIGVPRFDRSNGDCYYAVMALPHRDEFVTATAVSTNVRVIHSRRFGSRSSPEACSAVDIFGVNTEESAPGGYFHEFENPKDIAESLIPDTSMINDEEISPMSPVAAPPVTHYPTYSPSASFRPTVTVGVVPDEVVADLLENDEEQVDTNETVAVDPESFDDASFDEEQVDDEVDMDVLPYNMARRVRISHQETTTGIIAMMEVEIYGTEGTNIASFQNATQSSDFSEDHTADRSVDGNRRTFSHTMSGYGSWWEVDLGTEVEVTRILIVNRGCSTNIECSKRLSNAVITLHGEDGQTNAFKDVGDTSEKIELEFFFGDSSNPPSVAPKATSEPSSGGDVSSLSNSPVTSGQSYLPTTIKPTIAITTLGTVPFDDIRTSYTAQKVKIQLPGDTSGPLHMFEVEVYDQDTVDVAKGMSASQSSDFNNNHVASRAVDGRLDTFSHTARGDTTAWWEVDLGGMVSISEIIIYNRWCTSEIDTDGCLRRLSNSIVSLIDDQGATMLTKSLGDTAETEIVIAINIAPSNSPMASIQPDSISLSPNVTPKPTLESPTMGAIDLTNNETGFSIIPSVASSLPPAFFQSSFPMASIQPDSISFSPSVTPKPTVESPTMGAIDPTNNGTGLSIFPSVASTFPPVAFSEMPVYSPIGVSTPPSLVSTPPPVASPLPLSGDGVQARLVKIQLSENAPVGTQLGLREVEIHDLTGNNIALSKDATQSSDDISGIYPASNAVDDDLNNYSLTDSDDDFAWWQVDLGDSYVITSVIIGNTFCPNDTSDPCRGRLTNSTLYLYDDQDNIVSQQDFGDTSNQEVIHFNFTEEILPRTRRLDDFYVPPIPPNMPIRPSVRNQNTRSVRLLVAGHVESVNFDDGYVVGDLNAGEYNPAKVYGFTQQIDIRLPLGYDILSSSLTSAPDFGVMNDPNGDMANLAYSLSEEVLSGFVTSGVDSKALLNDHLPSFIDALYPVALVADSTSKKDYYVLMLVSDRADVNDEGRDSSMHHDTTMGSGANQNSWTDFDDFGVPGVINLEDLFGLKGRPRFGSDYRIILKKMSVDSVNPMCFSDNQGWNGCKEYSSAEEELSSTSYIGDRIVTSQTWVQEFFPDLREDTRPAGVIFAPSSDSNTPDLLLMAGSTSGYGSAFGTSIDVFEEGDVPEWFDLDGFVAKIRADDGSFYGTEAFDPGSSSFTNMHSMRLSSQPTKNDVVASLCSNPPRLHGSTEPLDHVYVVGSTEGLLPSLSSGLRDESFLNDFPEKDEERSMEAFLTKINLATMNPVWTVQVGAGNLEMDVKGNVFGFGCAVTYDGLDVYLTGLVKDGGIVTDFSANSFSRHENVAHGGTDVFVASYNTQDGALNFLKQIGSTKDDSPSRGNGGVAVDRFGNAIVVGNTRGSLMRQRDASEYIYGENENVAASDIFIMSLERSTGEHAPLAQDTTNPIIPVDNNGSYEDDTAVSSAENDGQNSSSTEKSGASAFLTSFLVLLAIGGVAAMGFAYKARKWRQEKSKELHDNLNLSPHGIRTRSLRAKPGGSVLNQLEDLNIMVDVRNSSSGGWHGVYDDDAVNHIDFSSSQRGGHDDVIGQSLFMEGGLQGLEDIEKSANNKYTIGDAEGEEEATDEDLIQAYNEAMAVDIEPESDAVAAYNKDYNMPNLGSGLT